MKSINLVLAFLALAAAAPGDPLLSALEIDPPPRVPVGPDPSEVNCHTDKKEAKSRAIYREYKELLDDKGQPKLGPNSCNRVRCQKNSAIVWCNESEQEISFDNYDPIARGAGAVLKVCKVKQEKKRRISGKSQFDGWSVKVEKADC